MLSYFTAVKYPQMLSYRDQCYWIMIILMMYTFAAKVWAQGSRDNSRNSRITFFVLSATTIFATTYGAAMFLVIVRFNTGPIFIYKLGSFLVDLYVYPIRAVAIIIGIALILSIPSSTIKRRCRRKRPHIALQDYFNRSHELAIPIEHTMPSFPSFRVRVDLRSEFKD